MSDGRTSAVMALERRKELASELASQTPKMWTSELLGVNELDSATASQFDIAASQQPISRFMNEHIVSQEVEEVALLPGGSDGA